MTRLMPVVALVDDETMTRLRPLIDELTERFASAPKSRAWQTAQLMNGWTDEAIAWGLVIAAASREDLEIAEREGTTDDGQQGGTGSG